MGRTNNYSLLPPWRTTSNQPTRYRAFFRSSLFVDFHSHRSLSCPALPCLACAPPSPFSNPMPTVSRLRSLDDGLALSFGIAVDLTIICALPGLCGCLREGLLEVCNNIVNVLSTDRDANEVLQRSVRIHHPMCGERGATLTSVTPLPIFSSSLSCSWVVVHG